MNEVEYDVSSMDSYEAVRTSSLESRLNNSGYDMDMLQ